MDDDHSGTITLQEFEEGLIGLGIHLEKYGPRALFRCIDEDGSDILSMEEVCAHVRGAPQRLSPHAPAHVRPHNA